MKYEDVRRLRGFFICGSEKVSQISCTSSFAKNLSIISMLVLRKATLSSFSSSACFAPVYMRAPLMSTPMKLTFGYLRAKPTAYSPRPQPSSRTIGFSFLKYCSRQWPFISNGTSLMTENGY